MGWEKEELQESGEDTPPGVKVSAVMDGREEFKGRNSIFLVETPGRHLETNLIWTDWNFPSHKSPLKKIFHSFPSKPISLLPQIAAVLSEFRLQV